LKGDENGLCAGLRKHKWAAVRERAGKPEGEGVKVGRRRLGVPGEIIVAKRVAKRIKRSKKWGAKEEDLLSEAGVRAKLTGKKSGLTDGSRRTITKEVKTIPLCEAARGD